MGAEKEIFCEVSSTLSWFPIHHYTKVQVIFFSLLTDLALYLTKFLFVIDLIQATVFSIILITN